MLVFQNKIITFDFFVFLFFGLFLPYFTAGLPGKGLFEYEFYLLWSGCIFYCAVLAFNTSRIGFAGSIFFGMIYVFFMLIPMVQINAYIFPLPQNYPLTPSVIEKAIYLLFLFVVGAFASLFVESKDISGPTSYRLHKDYEFRILTSGLICLSLTIIGLLKTGGLSALLSSRFERGEVLSAEFHNSVAGGAQIFESLARVPIVAFAVFFCIFCRDKVKYGVWWALMLSALALFMNNPLANSRFLFGVTFIAVSACWLPFIIKSTLRTVFTLLALGLVFVLPIFSTFRGGNADVFLQIAHFDIVTDVIGSMDFDAFQQGANAISYIEDAPLLYGLQILSAVFFWVPRSFWVDKGLPSGTLVSGNFDIGTDNLSMPMYGEFYLDFGYVGVPIMAFIFYRAVKRADFELRMMATGSASPWVVFFLLFAPYQVILLRGSLLGVFDLLFVYLIFVSFLRGFILENVKSNHIS